MTEADSAAVEVDVSILPKEVRRELESLSDRNREQVEILLAKARLVLEEDPVAAATFTQEAVATAGRVAVVREAAGVAAYHAGDYAVAKKNLQAARRISGRDDLIAMIADCERGLGQPERALELADSPEARRLRGAAQAELLLVVAGARQDMGEDEMALAVLETVATQSAPHQPWSARIYYAYADALAASGDLNAARDWFSRSALTDESAQLDGSERITEIDELQ